MKMPPQRKVQFGLQHTRVFRMQPEHSAIGPLRPYRTRRRGVRSPVANGETDGTDTKKQNRALERAAHANAIVVNAHDKAESVMALLGKMRFHPQHRAIWAETGRDAKEEDERRELGLSEETCAQLRDEIWAELDRGRAATGGRGPQGVAV